MRAVRFEAVAVACVKARACGQRGRVWACSGLVKQGGLAHLLHGNGNKIT